MTDVDVDLDPMPEDEGEGFELPNWVNWRNGIRVGGGLLGLIFAAGISSATLGRLGDANELADQINRDADRCLTFRTTEGVVTCGIEFLGMSEGQMVDDRIVDNTGASIDGLNVENGTFTVAAEDGTAGTIDVAGAQYTLNITYDSATAAVQEQKQELVGAAASVGNAPWPVDAVILSAGAVLGAGAAEAGRRRFMDEE